MFGQRVCADWSPTAHSKTMVGIHLPVALVTLRALEDVEVEGDLCVCVRVRLGKVSRTNAAAPMRGYVGARLTDGRTWYWSSSEQSGGA